MSASNNPESVIKAFLTEGIDELPDRSYDAVRTAIGQRRQWAVIGPWKESQILTATRLALIAAAIVVVAVVAIRFLPATNIGPAPRPSPTPSPSPLSLPITGNGPSPIAAGTYFVSTPFPVPFTVTIPSSWKGNVGGPNAVFLEKTSGTNNVSFTVNQSLYADACHFSAGLLKASPGPSANDLAAALAAIRGVAATGPTDVSIGGYSGKQVTLTAPFSTSNCDLAPDGFFRIWNLPLGATEDIQLGWTDRLVVLDVGNQRLVIQNSGPQAESTSNEADVNAIMESLVFNQ